MLRLYCLLLLVFAVVWQAGTASAAERVLLGTAGQASAASTSLPSGTAIYPLGASAQVKALRAVARQAGTVKVIVGLRVPFAPAVTLAPAEAAQQGLEIAAASTALRSRFAGAIARAPGSFRAYSTIPFIALEVTPAELDQLTADPNVISLGENILLRPNLAESAALIRAPEAWASGYTGNGEVIAIIDSGIETSHPFLGGRVVSEACYTNGQCPGGTNASTVSGSGAPCTGAEDCVHGTHVAGIAAGYLSSTFSGIAPKADIISIRVFTVRGGESAISIADVNSALERVYQLRSTYKIAAVNMSLGSTLVHYSSPCDTVYPATAALVNQLKAAGIATVIASGNEGMTDGLSTPACLQNAVSVGSVSDSDWGLCSFQNIPVSTTATDKVACYSNTSPNLTLLAPGSAIASSITGGGFATLHGTSMAAPHVAGAFAVLRDKAPGASVDDIVTALRNTGKPVTDYRNGSITTPRIDVKEAVDAIDDSAGLYPLRLYVNGNGRGQVTLTSSSKASSCSASCESSYAIGAVVTLTARSGANSFFAGWGGACRGVDTTCTVTMTAARTVFAVFYTVTTGPQTPLMTGTTGGGEGSVTVLANGQTTVCNGTCNLSFSRNAMVRITATPTYGSALTTWTGACKGRKSTCTLRLKSTRTATANFETLPIYSLNYAKAGDASGSIAISAGDRSLTCGTDCSNSFPAGTKISLTAIPAGGKTFAGWQGVCKGRKKSCTFTLKGSVNVSASFN